MNRPSGASGAGRSAPLAGTAFPEGFALGAAAVLGAVLALAGLLIVRQLTGGDASIEATDTSIAASAGTSPGTLQPPTEPPEDPPGDAPAAQIPPPQDEVEVAACPAGLDQAICDAAELVQLARGRAFKTFPEIEMMDDPQFDEALLEGFEEYRAELELDGVLLQALGLLDPQVELVDSFREALKIGVVGFYDPEEDFLAVRGVELDLHTQQVVAHELTHALDDQWFELGRDDFADGDAEYGFTAVVEGNARRIEELWRAELDREQTAQLQEEELDLLSLDELQQYLGLPPIVRQLLLSPYVDGLAYVQELLAGGGEAAVDQALISPPESSEEILHPGLDRRVDPEVVVEGPSPQGELVDQGRLGEIGFRLWLGQLAGEGWGGDRYVTWVDASGASCFAVDVVADTPEDLVDIETTAEGWVLASPVDRSIEPIAVGGGDALRISGCT
jgi:hypothetical protein